MRYPLNPSRREFLAGVGSAAVSALALGPDLIGNELEKATPSKASRGPICLFSKHLQWLDFDEMAETAAEIGFEGVALTVRPNGHVLPHEAEDKLPLAVESVQRAGLTVPMITTAIVDPADEHTEPILRTASALGVKAYRMGYLDYPADRSVIDALRDHRAMMRDLMAINRNYRLHGAYQNHAGTRVGGPVWDVWHLLEGLDPEWIGCQYDIRHATAEGGTSWPIGLRLLAPYIRITALKDFRWERREGVWRIIDTPIGEGMVDFDRYFGMIRDLQVAATMSVHFEYQMPHDRAKIASAGVRRDTMTVMKRDVDAIKSLLNRAGLD